MQRIHELKCWTESYQAIVDGVKLFEYRLNDRDYQVGDILFLREWNSNTKYTGRECCYKVTWILKSGFGLPECYCVLSLEPAYTKFNDVIGTLEELKFWIETEPYDLSSLFRKPSNEYQGGMKAGLKRVISYIDKKIEELKDGKERIIKE
jgi:hypothetical protein